MLNILLTPLNRVRTLILLSICGLSAIAATIVGIDDNLPGILLAFLAAFAFVFAFVHPWRTARQFRFLLITSALGIVLFVILNNVFAFLAHNSVSPGVLQCMLQSLAVVAFLLAAMIFPAAFIVGAAGWIVMFMRSRRRPT